MKIYANPTKEGSIKGSILVTSRWKWPISRVPAFNFRDVVTTSVVTTFPKPFSSFRGYNTLTVSFVKSTNGCISSRWFSLFIGIYFFLYLSVFFQIVYVCVCICTYVCMCIYICIYNIYIYFKSEKICLTASNTLYIVYINIHILYSYEISPTRFPLKFLLLQ